MAASSVSRCPSSLHSAEHAAVVTVEDGLAEGGAGAMMSAALAATGPRPPRVLVLGTPTKYLGHAAPNTLLAELGLDAAGITESALRFLGLDNRPRMTP